MRYVALLRAVNAGKASRITMDALRTCVEQRGVRVRDWYVTSGNLVIEAPRTRGSRLAEQIGQAVGERLGRPTTAIVLTRPQLDRVLRSVPAPWHDEPDLAHEVIFFTKAVTAAQLLAGIRWDPDLEQLTPAGGCIYWSIRVGAATPSALGRLSRTSKYQQMTVRSLHTLEHLQQLMLHQSLPRP